MDIYQRDVLRTANRGTYPSYVTDEGKPAFDAMTWALGCAGEAGEVADLIKKGIGHSHGVDREKLKKELGDVLWYVGALAHAFGLKLSDVAAANTAKLRARYPDGFSVEASKVKADERVSYSETCRGPDEVVNPVKCARECVEGCPTDAPCVLHCCNAKICMCAPAPWGIL